MTFKQVYNQSKQNIDQQICENGINISYFILIRLNMRTYKFFEVNTEENTFMKYLT